MTSYNIAIYFLLFALYGLTSAGPAAVPTRNSVEHIPLDMGRLYTRDEVDLLSAGVVVPRDQTSIKKPAIKARYLDKTDVTVNSVWTCPTYGAGLKVTQEWVMELSDDGSSVSYTATSNVDSFEINPQTGYLDGRSYGYFNEATYQFCETVTSKGYVCTYQIEQGFYGEAQQELPTPNLIADFMGDDNLVEMYEYCVDLISLATCSTVLTTLSGCTLTDWNELQTQSA